MRDSKCICSRPYGGEHEHGCPAAVVVPPAPRVAGDVDWRAKDTAPPSDDLISEIVELKAALTNVGELCTRLVTRLSRVQLAMLANEHKANTATEIAREALDAVGKLRLEVEALQAAE